MRLELPNVCVVAMKLQCQGHPLPVRLAIFSRDEAPVHTAGGQEFWAESEHLTFR